MVAAEKRLSIVSDPVREGFKSWIDEKVNDESGKGTISQGRVQAYQYARVVVGDKRRSLVEVITELRQRYQRTGEPVYYYDNDFERAASRYERDYSLAGREILSELEKL